MNLYTVWVPCTLYTPLKVKNKLIAVSASDRLMINFPSIFYYNYTKGVIFYANARFIERENKSTTSFTNYIAQSNGYFHLFTMSFNSIWFVRFFLRVYAKNKTTTIQFWWTGIRILVLIRNFPRNKSREFSWPKHQCNCH